MPPKKKKKPSIPKKHPQQRQPPTVVKVEALPPDLWRILFPRLHAAEVTQAVLSLGCHWVADLALEDLRLGPRPRTLLGHSDLVMGCAFSPSGETSYARFSNGTHYVAPFTA